jgi:hypothetical protein
MCLVRACRLTWKGAKNTLVSALQPVLFYPYTRAQLPVSLMCCNGHHCCIMMYLGPLLHPDGVTVSQMTSPWSCVLGKMGFCHEPSNSRRQGITKHDSTSDPSTTNLWHVMEVITRDKSRHTNRRARARFSLRHLVHLYAWHVMQYTNRPCQTIRGNRPHRRWQVQGRS